MIFREAFLDGDLVIVVTDSGNLELSLTDLYYQKGDATLTTRVTSKGSSLVTKFNSVSIPFQKLLEDTNYDKFLESVVKAIDNHKESVVDYIKALETRGKVLANYKAELERIIDDLQKRNES